MQNPDDDFYADDIVFDDQTLALLDQEEQKFVSQSKDVVTEDPPPAKRQRTTYNWNPRHNGLAFVDDSEDLPEISIQSDGSYGLRGTSNGTTAHNQDGRTVSIGGNGYPPVRPARPVAAGAAGFRAQPPHLPSDVVTATSSNSFRAQTIAPPRQNTRTAVRSSPIPRAAQGQPSTQKQPPANRLPDPDDDEHVEELRQQVEEVLLYPCFKFSEIPHSETCSVASRCHCQNEGGSTESNGCKVRQGGRSYDLEERNRKGNYLTL
jgi:hypothetical protein